MKPFPNLSTERLLLREIQAHDIEDIFRGLSHPKVIEYYGVNYKTMEETQEQMDFYKKLQSDGTGIFWAVCNKNNGAFYGVGGFNNLSKIHQKAEISFWLLPDFWGNGIMSEAMKTILKFGFEKLLLHRIEGFVESGNINCKKALAKLDFTHEGTMHECEVKNGAFIDLEIYSKLNNHGNGKK